MISCRLAAATLLRNQFRKMSTRYFDGRTGAEVQDKAEAFGRVKQFTEQARTSGKKSIVFVGENHEDPSAHEHELELVKHLLNEDSALSLEFYERDTQPVLNEYLWGSIDYGTFAQDARAPSNHEDYKPMLEHCQAQGIPVVAANCARRYSRMVGRQGRGSLEELTNKNPDFYKMALPPVPYAKASEKYCNKFKDIMGIVASGKDEERVLKMLDAQTLWDASMAQSIAKAWFGGKDTVLHVCGYFHCQYFLGIGEHLSHYYDKKNYDVFTIVIFPEDPEKLEFNPEEHTDIADLLVLTDISKMV